MESTVSIVSSASSLSAVHFVLRDLLSGILDTRRLGSVPLQPPFWWNWGG